MLSMVSEVGPILGWGGGIRDRATAHEERAVVEDADEPRLGYLTLWRSGRRRCRRVDGEGPHRPRRDQRR
jgi:hypothetical protein